MNEMLIAEELCVLRMRESLDGTVWGNAATGIIGAAVVELVLRGRADMRGRGGEAPESIAVIDVRPIGHELLDETLSLLTRTGGTPAEVRWRPARMSGRSVRRRLRDGGELKTKDLAYWWFGSWRCAEFPDLAPTLVVQLLRLHETLERPVLRILDDLKASGVIKPNGRHSVLDPIVYRDVRERVRNAARTTHGRLEPRVAHLLALRSLDTDWLKVDIEHEPTSRKRARSKAESVMLDLPIATAVKTITDGYRQMLDWYDGC